MRQRFTAAVSVFPTAGVWPAIWCVVAAAIYGCVPETDHMKPVAVMVIGALFYELVVGRRLPWVVHVAIAAAVLWSGLYGATGRERAYVGAVFAFWPAVIVPLLTLVYPPLGKRPEPVRWAIAAFGGGAALIVARTGALEPGYGPALRSVAIWGSVSLAVSVVSLFVLRNWRPVESSAS